MFNEQMMGVYRSARFYSLRLLRIVVDFATSFIFGFIYGKPKQLPPIKDDILLMSATKLAEKIRKKQLKSVDVVSSYIARIKDVQPIINAVVEDRFESALAEARNLDDLVASGVKSEEEMARDFPLLGVPFSVKEHISVKGMHCTSGLVALKDKVSAEDAEIVKLMRNAGGIPIVTTNVPELCMWWESSNNLYGITCNPYDTRRTCGGSSGGEGGLIGAGASVIGIGSDIGGSIRLPAVMNGIFGHKPSSGVVSYAGVSSLFPESVRKYSTMGPMCRYGVDLLPLMKIMTKNHPNLKLDEPVKVKRLKIYYADDIGDCPLSSPVTTDVRKAMKMALNHFEEMYGIKPIKIDLKGMSDAVRLWNNVIAEAKPPPFTEALTAMKGRINVIVEFIKWFFRLSDHTLHGLYFAFMDTYLKESSSSHQEALQKFENLRSQFDNIMKDNCVFLYPTQPEPAPFRHETLIKYWNLGYTAIFNVLLYPVTHIPMILSEGLPVGIQCAAGINNDHLTIAVATELGKAYGGWTSPSPIA